MIFGERTDRDVKEIVEFTGLRNTVSAESFGSGDLEQALNVDITAAGKIRRRKGATELQAGSYHSVWSDGAICFVVAGTTLYRYHTDGALEAMVAGLSASRPMSYVAQGARVYMSNGVTTRMFADGIRPWGITPPTMQPTATEIGGSLPSGRYQFAMTFVRADGTESGTGLASVIDIDSGGIGFQSLPVSDDITVVGRNLYISPVNGDKLFLLAELGVAETAATYMTERIGHKILETQHLSPPPPGDILALYNGRMYVAVGRRLYPSLPYAPELFDLRAGFTFPSTVTLVAPVKDGIYVGTETSIVFLSGASPEKFEQNVLTSYGAIPGTLSYADTELVTEGGSGEAAFFATNEGLCVGMDGGALRNLTRERFLYPQQPRGASVVRTHGGVAQLVAVLQGAETPADTAF